MLAAITIGIPPDIHLGPLTLAWHGLTIAIGILVGAWLAGRLLRDRGLSDEPLFSLTVLIAVAGMVGGRIFYVIEHGGPLLGTRGFTFAGGLILAAVAVPLHVRRRGLPGEYLHAIAVGLPLGVAVGRIGDVINGEHYGPRSDFFLAVRNSHPDALTPDASAAFHNGGLYESLAALVIFLFVFPLRHRIRRPADMVCLVLALFSVARFVVQFGRADPELALGLSNAQWTSLGMLAVVGAGWLVTRRARVVRTT